MWSVSLFIGLKIARGLFYFKFFFFGWKITFLKQKDSMRRVANFFSVWCHRRQLRSDGCPFSQSVVKCCFGWCVWRKSGLTRLRRQSREDLTESLKAGSLEHTLRSPGWDKLRATGLRSRYSISNKGAGKLWTTHEVILYGPEAPVRDTIKDSLFLVGNQTRCILYNSF